MLLTEVIQFYICVNSPHTVNKNVHFIHSHLQNVFVGNCFEIELLASTRWIDMLDKLMINITIDGQYINEIMIIP